MEVRAGDEHSGSHSLPGLVELLDGLPAERKPALVRGDCGFGSDTLMRPLEERGQGYLFKLKLSKNVKRHIERLFCESGWADAENAFDELKNQWGWGGFTTHDCIAAGYRRGRWRWPTTGGACSCGWRIPRSGAKRSRAGRG